MKIVEITWYQRIINGIYHPWVSWLNHQLLRAMASRLHGVHSMKDLVQGEDGDHAWFTVEMRLAPFNFNIC